MKKIILFFIAAYFCNNCKIFAQAVSSRDSMALVILRNKCKFDSDSLGWYSNLPVTKWPGVTVTGSRVTGIELPGEDEYYSNGDYCCTFYQLKGKLPENIFDSLTELRVLDLNLNELTGNIPGTITKLSKLTYLDISRNVYLTGHIPPSIGRLTELTSLYLAGDNLTGVIPPSIGRLTNLTQLNFYYDNLTGIIPDTLQNLTNLTYLGLGHNSLSGSIPKVIGNCSKLNQLYLDNNNLSGAIPASIGNCSNLSYLDLMNNNLSGAIPASLSNIHTLKACFFSHNHLTSGIDNLIKLIKDTMPYEGVDISYNNFTFKGLQYAVKANRSKNNFSYSPQALIPLNFDGHKFSVSAGGKIVPNTYTWFLKNTVVATITGDSTFTPATRGIYHVVVTNSITTALTLTSYTDTIRYNGNGFAKSLSSAATADINSSPQVLVYPNPSNNIISINLSKLNAPVLLLQIINSNGEILTEKSFENIKSSTTTFDVSKFATGNYFVLIKLENGTTITKKFIKE